MTSAGSQASSTTVSTVDADGGGPRVFRDDSWEFPPCEDVPYPSAPSEAYRDAPVYMSNEMPKDEVKAWARG